MPAQHLVWPLAINANGQIKTVDQRSRAELSQRVALLLSVKRGELTDEPSIGRPAKGPQGYTFEQLRDYIHDLEPDVPLDLVDDVITERAQTLDLQVAS